jgi:(1->4)-alpha-D-glucan 1-alpha-D-glucosylmutase
MNDAQTIALLPEHLAEAVKRRIQERQRLPQSTYRLQLYADFTFRHARAVVPYLAKLGISDCYCSPFLRARPESKHGYDICQHGQLNPELGDAADFQGFVDELAAFGMGMVLDFVPNHMAADPEMNHWWHSVLEDGPSSPYASFFDIDWHPVKSELEGKVLLPFLGDHYGIVLEHGELQLAFEDGALALRYHEHKWPIDPGQYPRILRSGLGALQITASSTDAMLRASADPVRAPAVWDGAGDADISEFLSVLTALEHLPRVDETDPDRKAERQREKKVARERLVQVTARSPRIRKYIEDTLRAFNGQPGQPRSFDRLHELLEALPYRLAYWRTASDEVNYRRFFDINDLVGVRIEEPAFFLAAHELVLRLIRERQVTGLRLDHLDGLFDPAGYLDALQDAVLWEWTRDLMPPEISAKDWRRRIRKLVGGEGNDERGMMNDERKESREGRSPFIIPPSSVLSPPATAHHPLLSRPLFVVVEKILSGNETLPESWPIYGASGYDFLNDLNRLFVDSKNMKPLTRAYEHFTGQTQPLAEVVYESKMLITWTSMASELNILADALNRLSEGNRRARDFTLNNLRETLRQVVACFPVYRTYVSEWAVTESDRHMIDLALTRARQRNPNMEPLIFDFVRQVLMPKIPVRQRGADEEKDYRQRLQFAMRFQQYTGPVQAKGLEDTACYRYNRLLSLNEVGGDPQRFGSVPDQFHESNRQRRERWPYALLATATHDTKRGEDARARLNVLSEIPGEWRRLIFQWSRVNAGHRTEVHGQKAPDRNDEYLFYQALLGVWPAEPARTRRRFASDELVQRLRDYMLKAVKEAKVHSSWLNPNKAYDQAVTDFVHKTLAGPRAARFLASFLPFQQRVAKLGMINSLSQTLLKLVSPGIPDVYQGTELWDLSLVDPDNRRPVDFAHRIQLLNDLEPLGNDEGGMMNDELKEYREERSSFIIPPPAFDASLASRHSTRSHRMTEMLKHWEDGRIKLMLLACGLRLRRRYLRLFSEGEYLALRAAGEKADHVVAILRRHEDHLILAVAPRLVASLCQVPKGAGEGIAEAPVRLPVGENIWKSTRLDFHSSIQVNSFHNVLTGEHVPVHRQSGQATMNLADALSVYPIALFHATMNHE